MRYFLKTLFYGCVSLIIFSCGGGSESGGDDDVIPPSPPPAALTDAVSLMIPINNDVCTDFTSAEDNDFVRISLQWSAVTGARSYEVNIKQLNTNTIQTVSVSGVRTSIVLLRNTRYEWFVTGINADNVKGVKGEKFTFTTPALGAVNTAPYVELLLEFDHQNDILNVSWEGIDPDNDIIIYTILVFENDNEILFFENTNSLFIDDIPARIGSQYKVEVFARDSNGNGSRAVEVRTYDP